MAYPVASFACPGNRMRPEQAPCSSTHARHAVRQWGRRPARHLTRELHENSPRRVTTSAIVRRQLIQHAAIALVGTRDPTTVLNAVLSGYGLPTLGQGNDLTTYDEFEDEFTFDFPKKWVARPNSQRGGVYISDFNTADKVTVDIFKPARSSDSTDLISSAVATIVNPQSNQQDDRLEMPDKKTIKMRQEEADDGRQYIYLEFPSYTITRSGYSIKRKNFAAVSVIGGPRGDEAVVLNTSARSDQFNEPKRDLLQSIVKSFRVRL